MAGDRGSSPGRLALVALVVLAGALGVWRWQQSASREPSRLSSRLTGPPGPGASGEGRARARARWGSSAVALSAGQAEADGTAAQGAFAGRVVSAGSGEGVTGAQLSFERGGALQSISADAGGQFRFVPTEAGLHTLAVVTAPGFLPFAPELGQSPLIFQASPGRRVEGITVQLVPAIRYTGKVVDPQGAPVPGAQVSLLGTGAGGGLVPLTASFVSDARGELQFSAPDGAVLEARAAGFAPGRARLDFSAQASHRLVIRLRAAGAEDLAAARIEGQVVGPAGPLEGAQVTAGWRPANPGDPRARLVPELAATAGPEGRFVLEGLAEGSYRLEASAEGLAPTRLTVASGSSGVVLRLGPGGRLTGQVKKAGSGQPLVAFSVHLVRHDGPLARSTLAVRSFFAADGHFLIDDLPAGPLGVVALAEGHAPSPEQTVEIAAGSGAPLTTVVLELSRGGRVHGLVVSKGSGQPLARARVSREGLLGTGGAAVPLSATALTDDQGAFELVGLGPGWLSLSVAARDHHGRVLSGLTLGADGTLGPVRVELSPTRPGEEPRIELVGIGAVLAARGDALVIGQVLPGGGAAEAGLMPGDAIVSVDGQDVVELGFEGAIGRIRGLEGTTVRLGVRRAGATDPVLVEVPRRPLKG